MTATRSIKTCKLSFSCFKIFLNLPQGDFVLERQDHPMASWTCLSCFLSSDPSRQTGRFHLHSKLTIGSVERLICQCKPWRIHGEHSCGSTKHLNNFLHNKKLFSHLTCDRENDGKVNDLPSVLCLP